MSGTFPLMKNTNCIPCNTWVVGQLAEYLQISPEWILANLASIPHLQFVTEIRFEPDQINAWLAQQRRASAGAVSGTDGTDGTDEE